MGKMFRAGLGLVETTEPWTGTGRSHRWRKGRQSLSVAVISVRSCCGLMLLPGGFPSPGHWPSQGRGRSCCPAACRPERARRAARPPPEPREGREAGRGRLRTLDRAGRRRCVWGAAAPRPAPLRPAPLRGAGPPPQLLPRLWLAFWVGGLGGAPGA